MRKRKKLSWTVEGLARAATLTDEVYLHPSSEGVTEDEFILTMYRLGVNTPFGRIEQYITRKRTEQIQIVLQSLVKKGLMTGDDGKYSITQAGLEAAKKEKGD